MILLHTIMLGGTVTTSGDDKVHTFTGDGNFIVSSVGNSGGGGDKVSLFSYRRWRWWRRFS